MDVILKVISTVDSKLASLKQKDGQLIFCKDTRKILLDLNGVRTVYEQITTIDTESQRTEILAPVDGFYFVLDTHILWKYSAEWIQITSQPADVVKINQGSSNSGKFLGIGPDGNVVPVDAPSGGTVDTGQIEQAVNDYLEENPPSGMTSEQKEQLGKVWIEDNPSYTIAENKAQIFDTVENGKADKVTITDGSDYWDGGPEVSYPGTLNVKTLRGNRFYANMWLPNGMDMDQSYRYAANKNGQIRLYDILNQKSDLTGLSPWGICLKGDGKSFPSGQCHFIISKIRVLGLDSRSGKWKLVKSCKPIAALFDIAQTSSEGTFVDVDRTVLSDDMYMFSVNQPSSWTSDGDMCFHFYPDTEDAVLKSDIQECSKILISFRIRVQESENSGIFTCSCGCDALGGTLVEAFFSRFNAVTDVLQEFDSHNCLASESNLISDNLLYIDEILSDSGNTSSEPEKCSLPVMSDTTLGGGKAIAKTTETVPVAVDPDGKLWVPQQNSGGQEDAGIPYDGKTIVMFGDSIVAGWGWQEGYGITQPLKEKYTEGVWINQAVSGSNMANKTGSEHPSIVSKVKAYSGNADAILLEGGTNDVNNGITLGTISSGYDDTFDENTFTGALESCLRTIMNKYPLAYKFFLIPHNYAKDNSYVDSYHDRAKEVCEKWNMPVLDMRKRLQIAMTAQNKSNYTLNPNTDQGDGVHPTESLYRKFYSPLVDQFFRLLGMLDDMSGDSNPPTPENVPVTGVTLNKHSLTLTSVGQSEQLVATVSPPNATNNAVTWESDHVEYATVTQGGLVEAVATGSAVITVKTQDGNKTDTCQVTVDIQEPGGESYTELDYIQLDKNCYFDVGITPDVNTNTEISLHVDYPDPSGTYIAGARDSNYKYLISATDNYYAARGEISSAGKSFGLSVTSNVDIVFKQEGNAAYANENSVQFDAISTLNLTSHYIIGNCSNGPSVFSGQGLLGKIYYAKIYSGEDLVRDLIPVRKNQSNELCLYDKISETYYSNLSTGTLIGSDEI